MEDVVTSLSGTPALTSGQIRTSKNETFLANRTPVFQSSKKSAWKLHETGHLFRCLEPRPEVLANRTPVVSLQRPL